MADLTLQNAYLQAVAGNEIYSRYQDRWQFLLDSYQGGDSYRQGAYLQRYALESDRDYQMRLANVPLSNECRSVVQLYIAYLFRTSPHREFGQLENDATIADILEDADKDGRSMDAFMRDVATWSSVFGHVWICVAQPKTQAATLAAQQALNVRPYVSVYVPLAVLDWTWQQQPDGSYALSYIKVLEEINTNMSVVVEWRSDSITRTMVDNERKMVTNTEVLVNELGRLPWICAYAERSPVRGIGQSLIDDIADQQRMIYNELAEVYDSIRLDTHPSLVAPESVDTTGAAAGQVITIPENLPADKNPYVLQFQGGQIDKIYASIEQRRNMIDRMANVGSARGTESKEMSGIAMSVEFQLLNARIGTIAKNMELTEEQIWQEVCAYLQQAWTGSIDYPEDFAIRNLDNELDQLAKMRALTTRPEVQQAIDYRLAEMLDIESIEADDPQYVETSGAEPE